MRKSILIVIVVTLLCQSCQNFVHEEKITDRFFLIAVDSNQEMDVSYKVSEDGGFIGIIPAIVYAAGHDSKYVYAKQHPAGPNGKTNYYIVPIKITNPYKVEDEVIGPLDENQFYKKLDELGVAKKDDLFQITLENL